MTGTSRAGQVHVALLRGINVGGKNSLSMKDLVALFEAAGCSEVRTYIQSGNVVFRATDARSGRVPGAITRAIASRFGLDVPVILRSGRELMAVARAHPLLGSGVETSALHVVFLAEQPSAAKVRALDERRSPPDEFWVKGREIYLHCPNGVGRTRLTNAYFDGALATTSTMRNWRTLQKLAELVES